MEKQILDEFNELPAKIEYVSLTRRFNATLFDSLLSATITYGPSYFIPGWWDSLSVTLLFSVIDLCYKVVAEKVFGQTLGKKVANIIVTNQDLRLISWQQALVRNYYYVIIALLAMAQNYIFYQVQAGHTFLGFQNMQETIKLAYINYILAVWFVVDCLRMSKSEKNQTLHDQWANTYVVKETFLVK